MVGMEQCPATRGPHLWFLASSHRTSSGVVRYLRCDCGAFEIQCGSGVLASRDTPAAAVDGSAAKTPVAAWKRRASLPATTKI
jgi:hypothetical protein